MIENVLKNENRIYSPSVVIQYIEKYITEDYTEAENETGHWVNIHSPFYEDSRKRLGFNLNNGYSFDQKLQRGWPSFAHFVAEHQSCSLQDAEEILLLIRMKTRKADMVKAKVRKIEQEKTHFLNELTPEILPPMESFLKEKILRDKMGRKALMYVKSRFLEVKHIKKFNLSYVDKEECWACNGYKEIGGETCSNCNGSGRNKYHGRIIIPTYENGKFVYFQARDFLGRDEKWKYINPRVAKNQVVYFYDFLPEGERIYITEGPLDAMYLYDYPVTAIMGNKLSRFQIEKLLWKKPAEIVFIPDNDEKKQTKENVNKNLIKNINNIKEMSDYKIDIGVYKWFDISNKKDINSAGIDYIDEKKIFFPTKRVKDRILLNK